MKRLVPILAAAVFLGCNGPSPGSSGRTEPRATPADAPVEFLVTTAASDFHKHQSPRPSRFREVRVAYVVAPDGTTTYMLYGEFLPASDDGAAAWTPFLTIKTDPYEQWIGAQAKGYCEQPSIMWLDGDYSSLMQSRFDSQP